MAFFIILPSINFGILQGSSSWENTQEMSIGSLGWEDPLEEEMETHSYILAWRIPWTEEPGGL